MRNTKPLIVAAVALALVVVACGGAATDQAAESAPTAGAESAAPATAESAAPETAAGDATETAAAEGTTETGELTPVTLAIPVEPTLSIANFQVAKDRGFWEDHGLDVELLFGTSGVENIGAVTTGQADITYLDLANLGNVISEGETGLRVVMHWNPTNIFEVFALEESGIETAADLEGKKVGISGLGSVTRYMLQGALAEEGLTEEDVELITVGATRVAALQSGQVDALSAWDQIRAQVEYSGSETVDLPLGQSDIIPSNLLAVTDETLQERPEFVRDFVAGLTEATQWAVDNPDGTVETMQEFLPAQFEDEQFGREQMEIRLESFGNYDQSQPYGYMDVEQYQEAADLLAESGAIPATFEVSEYVTNDYLAEGDGS